MAITITENAARHIASNLSKRGKGVGLRLGVRTSGCSGLAYKLEYADEIRPEDLSFQSHGVTVVVDDVTTDPRYLACSLETKSEIVAPVFVRGRVAGELDIDSHVRAAFGPEDRRLVEHCAALVGRYLERAGAAAPLPSPARRNPA
jgi:iron-sulfur cluster assembly accessory protein